MKNTSLNRNNFGRDLLSVLNGINKKQFSNARVVICRKAESAKFTDITDKDLNCIGFRNVNVNGSKLILSDGGGPVRLNDFLEDIQNAGAEKLRNIKELVLSTAPECRYASVKYLPNQNILVLVFDVPEDSGEWKSKFGEFLGESSKIYTKKQIQEAISYWRKQLAKGNYRKVNEAVEAPAGTYRIVITVDGRPVDPTRVLTNVDLGNDDRTVCTFVRDSGIPEEFFANDEELYSRELYTSGAEINIDGGDDQNLPSMTEPSYFYENIDDFDAETNVKTCIPSINYENRTITYAF